MGQISSVHHFPMGFPMVFLQGLTLQEHHGENHGVLGKTLGKPRENHDVLGTSWENHDVLEECWEMLGKTGENHDVLEHHKEKHDVLGIPSRKPWEDLDV